jgi:hypothetical protein
LANTDLGRSLIARFDALEPKKRLLGEYLSNAREALERARKALAAQSRAEYACGIDEFPENLWRLVLVSTHRAGVQKAKHEIRAARGELDQEALESYGHSRRVAGTDRRKAACVLEASMKMILGTLGKVGVERSILGECDV